MTIVRINAGLQIVAAAALATGRAPRLSSTVLAASLLPTTIAGHAFWREQDPGAKATQRLNFFKGVSLRRRPADRRRRHRGQARRRVAGAPRRQGRPP